jgi:hypothetical protein
LRNDICWSVFDLAGPRRKRESWMPNGSGRKQGSWPHLHVRPHVPADESVHVLARGGTRRRRDRA